MSDERLVETNKLIEAARHADWMQVVLNGGPPCFHFEEERGRFCLRAERWHDDPHTHPFVPLAQMLVNIMKLEVDRATTRP